MTTALDPMNTWPRSTWRAMHSHWIGALIVADGETREWLFGLTDHQLEFDHFLLAALRGRLRATVHLSDDEQDGVVILWGRYGDEPSFRIGGVRLADAGLDVAWCEANERLLVGQALAEAFGGAL